MHILLLLVLGIVLGVGAWYITLSMVGTSETSLVSAILKYMAQMNIGDKEYTVKIYDSNDQDLQTYTNFDDLFKSQGYIDDGACAYARVYVTDMPFVQFIKVWPEVVTHESSQLLVPVVSCAAAALGVMLGGLGWSNSRQNARITRCEAELRATEDELHEAVEELESQMTAGKINDLQYQKMLRAYRQQYANHKETHSRILAGILES